MNHEQKIFADLKKIGLDEREKREMKLSLLRVISENRQVTEEPIIPARRFWFLNWSARLRYATLSAIILILAFSGVSALASQAQPGDLLYSFKTGINENIQVALAFSDQAKAQVNADLAQQRLNEIEKLIAKNQPAANNGLDQKIQLIQANFDQKSAAVREYIGKMQSGGDINGAISASSEFESTLQAHQAILSSVASTENVSSAVTPLVNTVASNSQEITRNRVAFEMRVYNSPAPVRVPAFQPGRSKTKALTSPLPNSAPASVSSVSNDQNSQSGQTQNSDRTKAAAEDTFAQTRQLTDKIKNEYPINQNDSSAATNMVRTNLVAIDQLVASASQDLHSDRYTQAFLTYQQAWRLAHQADLLIGAKKSLDGAFKLDFGNNGTSSFPHQQRVNQTP